MCLRIGHAGTPSRARLRSPPPRSRRSLPPIDGACSNLRVTSLALALDPAAGPEDDRLQVRAWNERTVVGDPSTLSGRPPPPDRWRPRARRLVRAGIAANGSARLASDAATGRAVPPPRRPCGPRGHPDRMTTTSRDHGARRIARAAAATAPRRQADRAPAATRGGCAGRGCCAGCEPPASSASS